MLFPGWLLVRYSFLVASLPQSNDVAKKIEYLEESLSQLKIAKDSLDQKYLWVLEKGLDGYVDGFVEERCYSSALAMELPLSCINP